MSSIFLDVFNNINFNQSAEEGLLFGWELMKRNRHTYGTLSLFIFFCLSLRCYPCPDPYAIWERVDEKTEEPNTCSVSFQPQEEKNQKVSLPCLAHSHGHMKVKVTLDTPFNGPPFFFWWILFYFEGNTHCESVSCCQVLNTRRHMLAQSL